MKKPLLFVLLCHLCISAFAQSPYVIYPVPQQQIKVNGTASFTSQVDVVTETDIDEVTRNRLVEILSEKGITPIFTVSPQEGRATVWLGVNGSGEAADMKATEMSLLRTVFSNTKYDRHILALREKSGIAQLVVLGENTDAVFCGLASLEQILDVAGIENLQCVTLYDFADIRERGIVEGYYGVPYSRDVTKDIFRYMARFKLNTYMYGAKSDPYHSQYWESPYPTSITADQEKIGYLTQDMLRDITSEAHRCKVNFIWAIHPGGAFTNSGNTTVVSNIMKKFEAMYDLGVRQFGVFVDDVGVPTDAATLQLNADRVTEIQNLIDAKWNIEEAEPSDTVKPLFFVPQLYVLSWSSVEGCQKFFGALNKVPSKVQIFITGNYVWTVPNSTDLATAKSYLGRNLAWWWNYPCNDNDVTKLFPMDTYSNFSDEKHISASARMEQNLQGTETLLSNPMQQGEVSKISFFSIADYAWNNSAFNNEKSWEASFEAVCGKEYATSLRKLAPYLRYYDSDDLATLISTFKSNTSSESARNNLRKKVCDLHAASQHLIQMKNSEENSLKLLYQDMSPWLICLNHMLEATDKFLIAADKSLDKSKRWENYLSALDLKEAFSTDPAHQFNVLSGLGSSISLSIQTAEPSAKTLMPFVSWLSENALKDIFPSSSAQNTTFITNSPTLSYNPLTSSSGNCYLSFSKPATLQSGEYLGLALAKATRLADIVVKDTLAANNTILYSANGKQWSKLSEVKPLDEYIKYIVIANTTTLPHAMKLNRENFCIVLPTMPKISNGTAPAADSYYDGHIAANFYDGDYSTYTCIERNQQDGDAYTLQLAEVTNIYDVRICMGTVNDDYMTVGRVQISENGSSWTNLPVMGTNITNYRLTLSQNVKWSDEMTYCDFNGKGKQAKYVRLYLQTPNTSKWLRLYEIEVNRQHHEQQFQSACTTGSNKNLPLLTDGDPSTTTAITEREAIYRLVSMKQAESLEFFTASSASDPINVEISYDGETWQDLATISSPYYNISLLNYPDATSLRLSTIGNSIPSIYEIKENAVSSQMPDITSISPSFTNYAKNPFYISGRNIHFSSNVKSYSIYTADGRLLCRSVSAKNSGSPSSYKVERCINSIRILRIYMKDGTKIVRKIIL